MSYLFPEGSTTELGVVEVGSNINVLDGVISIPQSVDPTADITFNDVNVNGDLNIAGDTLSLGSISAGNIFDNSNRVVTSITPSAGAGISLTSVTTNGPASAFTVNNTGVLSLIAGTGISISGSTGNITITATETPILSTKGVSANYTLLSSDDYVGATVSGITLTLPPGVTGQQYILKNEGGSGACTIAATTPDTIDGSATKSMNSNASISVIFRAGAWRII